MAHLVFQSSDCCPPCRGPSVPPRPTPIAVVSTDLIASPFTALGLTSAALSRAVCQQSSMASSWRRCNHAPEIGVTAVQPHAVAVWSRLRTHVLSSVHLHLCPFHRELFGRFAPTVSDPAFHVATAAVTHCCCGVDGQRHHVIIVTARQCRIAASLISSRERQFDRQSVVIRLGYQVLHYEALHSCPSAPRIDRCRSPEREPARNATTGSDSAWAAVAD